MIWTVHRKAGTVKVVPDGLAKWALVFGTFWLLWHRLWWEALAFFLLTLLVNRVADMAFGGAVTPAILLTLGLTVLPRLWLMLEGNEIRRGKLARQGYEDDGLVHADDGPTAEALV